MNALILELKIRSLIEDKRMISAMADAELSRGGWSINWAQPHADTDAEIQSLLGQLEKVEVKK